MSMCYSSCLSLATTALLSITAIAAEEKCPCCDEVARTCPEPDGPHGARRYTRSTARYEIPDVTLVDQHGRDVSLADELGRDGPVMLQFAFTTCPTICPALSSTLAAAREELRGELDGARLITITIDPEHDTPDRLRDYAVRLRADRRWRFLTGRLADVIEVQKAFDAYRGNKMNHEPLTFIRTRPDAPWIRLDGLMSAAHLAAEYREATDQ